MSLHRNQTFGERVCCRRVIVLLMNLDNDNTPSLLLSDDIMRTNDCSHALAALQERLKYNTLR